MAAWLDTFTGVLAIATGANVGEIGVGTESLTAMEVSPNTAAGMLFYFRHARHPLVFDFPSAFNI
jgi:hypothetical protein